MQLSQKFLVWSTLREFIRSQTDRSRLSGWVGIQNYFDMSLLAMLWRNRHCRSLDFCSWHGRHALDLFVQIYRFHHHVACDRHPLTFAHSNSFYRAGFQGPIVRLALLGPEQILGVFNIHTYVTVQYISLHYINTVHYITVHTVHTVHVYMGQHSLFPFTGWLCRLSSGGGGTLVVALVPAISGWTIPWGGRRSRTWNVST